MTDILPIGKILRVANAHLDEIGRYGDYERVIRFIEQDKGFMYASSSIDNYYVYYSHPDPSYYPDNTKNTFVVFDADGRIIQVVFGTTNK